MSAPRRAAFLAAALGLAAFLPRGLQAQCGGSALVCPGNGGFVPSGPASPVTLGLTLAHGFPTVPLEAGLNYVKVSPVYLKVSQSAGTNNYSESDSGGGVSVVYVHGFSSHWGWSATAGYAKTTGDISARVGTNNGTFASSTGPNSDEGLGAAVSLVWDPASGRTSFRLPISVGAGYISLKGDRGPMRGTFVSIARNGHAGSVEDTYKADQPALFLNVAPQWNTGPVRWTPFVFISAGLSNTTDTIIVKDLTTGERADTTYTAENNPVFGAGLELDYLPLNLSLAYIPGVPGNDWKVSTYTLSWSHRWGA